MIKKMIFSIIMLSLIALTFVYNKQISIGLFKLLDNQNKIVLETENEYKRYYSYYYVKPSEDFIPHSYNELVNIIYNVLNNGWDNFTFYCPIEYVNCIKDIKDITQNNVVLTHINNYVHPYNNFSNIKTTIDSSGQIVLNITKLYTKSQVSEIEFKVTEIMHNYVNKEDNLEDKIKSAHDYIINNTKYDFEKINNNNTYYSNIAYGTLIQGQSVCSGYADAMAIFLTKLNVPNFKVASDTHVWNAVYINENWYHLDSTWDDQLDEYGQERLIHKFFLINSVNLKKYASTDHTFDITVYQEFRYN